MLPPRAADAIIFLLDGETGLMPEDEEIARWLRTVDVPTVMAVNKSDRSGVDEQVYEFFALGFGDATAISAEHGLGLADLWDALEPHLAVAAEGAEEERRMRILGRLGSPSSEGPMSGNPPCSTNC